MNSMDPSLQPEQPQPQQPQPQQPTQQQYSQPFQPVDQVASPQQPVQPIQQPQPVMYQPPQATVQQATSVDPGATFGLLSLILSFFTGPVGVILGIIGLNKSKSVGLKNSKALAGIIIGSVVTVLTIALVVILFSSANNVINDFEKDCDAKDGTTIDTGNGTYRCEYEVYQYR